MRAARLPAPEAPWIRIERRGKASPSFDEEQSASLSPSARWGSGELRGLADAPAAAGERHFVRSQFRSEVIGSTRIARRAGAKLATIAISSTDVTTRA